MTALDGNLPIRSLVPDSLWTNDNIAIVAMAMMVAILLALLVREGVGRARERREAVKREAELNKRANDAWKIAVDLTGKYERATMEMAGVIEDLDRTLRDRRP